MKSIYLPLTGPMIIWLIVVNVYEIGGFNTVYEDYTVKTPKLSSKG
jgi:hypothetical protein